MAIIPIRDVPGNPVQPTGSELILIDNGIALQKATINDAVTPKATEIADQKIADLNLGTAAQANTEDFATAAQGQLADSAVQPAREIIAGDGLTGGGDLSEDRTISLDSASIASLAKADTAVQSVVAGANVTVDATDPQNPVVSVVVGGSDSIFATLAKAQLYAPTTAPDFIRVEGYFSAGDGGGALYKKVVSEPMHAGKFPITLADGVTLVWYEIAEEVISPLMIGAVVGTAADQATAIADTFDVANAIGARVYFPAGNYRQDTPISKSYGLKIDLHPEAIIDCREMANSSTAWTFAGSYGTAYSITAGAAVNTDTVTVSTSDAANFASGDYVIIRSADVFDASRTNSKIGEINRVKSVDTGTGVITLASPLQGTYSTSPVIENPAWVSGGSVTGGQFLSEDGDDNLNSAKTAITFAVAYKCFVEGVRFSRFDNRAVLFRDCFDCRASKNNIRRARTSSTGYAVSFLDATQDCSASENHFEDVSHALSTNNSSTRGGIPRRIIFGLNNIFVSAEAVAPGSGGGDAIDTHAAAEDIKIIGNTVVGATGQGINVECPSCEVIANTVVDSGHNGIAVRNESDKDGTAIVSHNVVKNAAQRGIYVYNGSGGTTSIYTSLVIQGNAVDTTTGVGIQVNSSSGRPMLRPVISGNTVKNPGGRAFDAYNLRNASISGNSFEGKAGSTTMNLRDVVGSAISGNTATQPDTSSTAVCAVTASSAGASTDNVITGNAFVPLTGSITGAGVNLDNNVQYTLVRGNIVRGTAGVSLGTGTGNSTNADNIT